MEMLDAIQCKAVVTVHRDATELGANSYALLDSTDGTVVSHALAKTAPLVNRETGSACVHQDLKATVVSHRARTPPTDLTAI